MDALTKEWWKMRRVGILEEKDLLRQELLQLEVVAVAATMGVLLEIFPRRNNKVVLFICLCSLSVYILCITVLIPNMRFRGKYNYTCVPCISIITTAEGERGRSRETLNPGFQNHDIASNIS
jgi:hypothetical protein